eukprot:COSAG06_NODE_28334_length_576_cov_1.037736_1_plen_23_part_10
MRFWATLQTFSSDTKVGTAMALL